MLHTTSILRDPMLLEQTPFTYFTVTQSHTRMSTAEENGNIP